MLYKKNSKKELSEELFKNPTSEYRGAPFWSWNCELDKDELLWQIEQLKKMGFGGFHMHSRDGLATEYLSDEFMDLVKICVDKAEKEQMLAWLYDEDRWPSGSAGGMVTKNPRYRQKYLEFTSEYDGEGESFEEFVNNGKKHLLAAYDIELNADGRVKTYSKISPKDSAKGSKWYAYIKTPEISGDFNNSTYVDTMSCEAMQQFINMTHEKYKEEIGEKFGNIIPAIFTDEPSVHEKHRLESSDGGKGTVPWTGDFDETFFAEYGYRITEKLPELFMELENAELSRARYDFHRHVSERFAEAFAKKCGDWCRKNGIAYTGHMFDEDSLSQQSKNIGSVMRVYEYFDIPGIDTLCDEHLFTTAKQAQSVARQLGKEGVMSELYGVTNWDFDFRGHKLQGDWEAALGITVRVPHLSWVSMKGSAKRDYPASINYQSPWYEEYSYVENHFARLNTALTRGKPIVKVGVIFPVESCWIHWGPNDLTDAAVKNIDTMFSSLNGWLLSDTIDFDYIDEALLTKYYKIDKNSFAVGEMKYSAVIVAGCETLRESTVKALEEFAQNGGKVIFAGSIPRYIDAVPSAMPQNLIDNSLKTAFEKSSIINALESERDILIMNIDKKPADNFIYQYREDNDCRWLFVAHSGVYNDNWQRRSFVSRENNVAVRQRIIVRLKGKFEPRLYDTISGEVKKINYYIKGGYTYIEHDLYEEDSLLLKLSAAETGEYKGEECKEEGFEIRYLDKCEFTLEEPNVCILDIAEYSLDGGEFEPREEILKLDSILRDRLGFINNHTQPWAIEKEKISHFITLKFRFESDIALKGVKFAFESGDEITLNGEKVENKADGYYVDKCIKTINLPEIKKGENIITLKVPFGQRTFTENCYLLGDFGVKIEGINITLVMPREKIAFGALKNFEMPFYGGNITYKTVVTIPECRAVKIKTHDYRGALVRVTVDGKDAGITAYSPYEIRLEGLKAGEHVIEYKLFGNRANTFGALHCNDEALSWFGPNAWDTKGDSYSYEYQLKDMGILSSPIITIIK